MSLETYDSLDKLYLARQGEVSACRPLLTGDVIDDVAIPGVDGRGLAIIIAHPCQMRGKRASLKARVLAARVHAHAPVDRTAWMTGFYDRMPLPELMGDSDLYVGDFSALGLVDSQELADGPRVACLMPFGINMLQQRLVKHMTRLEVETFRLHEACASAFDEADLLEEFCETVTSGGMDLVEAAALFDAFIRADRKGGTYQDALRDPQLRPQVRIACRTEARRICGGAPTAD